MTCVVCLSDSTHCFSVCCRSCTIWFDCCQNMLSRDIINCPVCRKNIHQRLLFVRKAPTFNFVETSSINDVPRLNKEEIKI